MSNDHPSFNRMGERTHGTSWFDYLPLVADRWLVTALVSLVFFGVLVAIGLLHPIPSDLLLAQSDQVEALFQALTAGIITAVTLVLALSQLILSQELGAAGDQRNRMEEAMSFRSDVADAIGSEFVAAEPSAFLDALVTAAADQARAVREALADSEAGSDRLTDYLEAVVTDADRVSDRLDGAEFGSFVVVHAALKYDYSRKLHDGRRLIADQDGELSSESRDALDRLIRVLELFGPAREHIKTLYFQWSLADLSRWMLCLAMPALAVTISSLLFLEPGAIGGMTLGVPNALLVVSAAVTLSLVPFTLLLVTVLRIVTVTKRTLAIGPFLLRETNQ